MGSPGGDQHGPVGMAGGAGATNAVVGPDAGASGVLGDVKGEAASAPMPDEESARGGELMPFDDGSMTSDKAQSSAMSLVVNYADPVFAAGTAIFGMNLLVLPLLARLSLPDAAATGDTSVAYDYTMHGETNPRQQMRLFNMAELKQRLGLLDTSFLKKEILMSADELDDYMDSCGTDATDEEVGRIQKWRDKVNTNMKSLQKRSALNFLGLPPDASEAEVNRMYKKLALELHPDKGGDPEKFQELQEMKTRLTDIENEDKKDDEDAEDEEARKAKELEKKEDEESAKLPPNERIKKLRMDMHDNALRLWERVKKWREEISGEASVRSNPLPALNMLRTYVDRFVAAEVKTLRHDDVRGAEVRFRRFVKQGAEILAVAAIADVQAALTTIVAFSYKLLSRSGSAELKARCDALKEAVAEIPRRTEELLKSIEDELAIAKETEKLRKEEKAREQKEREARGDFSGDGGAGASAKAPPSKPASAATGKAPGAPPAAGAAGGGSTGSTAPAEASKPSTAGAGAGGARPADPFADFDFGYPPAAGKPKAVSPRGAAASSKPTEKGTALRKSTGDGPGAGTLSEQAPKRVSWDPNFDHPYAGALKSNGTAMFCRPCQRWINTYDYNTEVFLTHVERVHPKPPPGFK